VSNTRHSRQRVIYIILLLARVNLSHSFQLLDRRPLFPSSLPPSISSRLAPFLHIYQAPSPALRLQPQILLPLREQVRIALPLLVRRHPQHPRHLPLPPAFQTPLPLPAQRGRAARLVRLREEDRFREAVRADQQIDAGVQVRELPEAGERDVVRARCVGLLRELSQAVDVAGGGVDKEEGAQVLGVGEALLREREIPRCEGGVADGFPAVLDVCGAGDGEGDGEVVEGEGEVEAVFWVGGDVEGHFLVALAFEEARDFVFLVVGDAGQDFGGGVHVAAEDEGLVFDDGEGEGVGDNVDVLVRDVGFSVAGEVAEEVHGLVEMRNGVGLVADEVVEAVGRVGVDEAVSDPLPCSYTFVDVGHDFEGRFDPVVFDPASIDCRDIVFARKAQDIERLLAC